MTFELAVLKREIDQMIQEAGDIYRSLDANEDGKVSTEEVKAAVTQKKAGANAARAFLYDELLSTMDAVDKNKDGIVSMVEFMLFYDKLKVKHKLH